MEANNAELSTEQVTNQETATDTVASTTNVSSIDAGDTAKGEQSSSEVSKDQSSNVENLFYDIQGEEVSHDTVMGWKNGHMMQSDFTKKSQLNAEERKGLEAKHVLADEKIASLSDSIEKVRAFIKEESTSEELEDLRDTDMAEWSRRKEAIAKKEKEVEQADKDLKAMQESENQERALVEHQLFRDSQPSWVDQKVMDADLALIESYVKDSEFSPEDFNSLQTHKLMNMALDASRYRKLQGEATETEKQVRDAPNVVKATVKKTKPKGKARSLYS
jgi:hypothetical protein